MTSFQQNGKFLDNIPRTNSDLNDYVVSDGVAYFNLYNQKNEKIATFIIDEVYQKINEANKNWGISNVDW